MPSELNQRLILYVDLLKALIASKTEQHRLGFSPKDVQYLNILIDILYNALSD